MTDPTHYQHLEAWPEVCSRYRGLFLKGRRLRADQIYSETVGEESRTPDEVARDFDLPLDAVLEAIDYCTRHEGFLRQERERELAELAEYDKQQPPMQPPPDFAEA